jgi:ATP synthase protein I
MSSDPSSGSSELPDDRGHRAERPSPSTPGPADPVEPEAAREAHRSADRKAQNDAWAASGLLMSGVIVWGGIGYLVSAWLDNQVFVMIGLLLGTATALYGIWFRYGRS